MFRKTLQTYTLFALCFVRIRSISLTSIIRFKCDNWRAKPSQGCMGTFILPNVLLTTSFCADNCQAIGNVPIIATYVHQHYKNYVHGKNFIARNDIALVVTTPGKKFRKLVKLSALDTLTTIGQKALIPIMDIAKPRLQVSLIESCYIEQPFGYHVCATNKISQQSIKVCEQRQEQGVPLLLDDRIFGIVGITDPESCSLPQRRFTAISPALYWISRTVKKIGYSQEVVTTLHDKTLFTTPHFIPTTTTTNTTTTKTPPPTTTPTTPSMTTPTLTESSTPFRGKTNQEEIWPKSKQFVRNAKRFRIPPFLFTNSRVTNATGCISANNLPVMRGGFTISRREDPNTAITFIPSPTLSTRKRTTLLPSSTHQVVTKEHTIPFFKINTENKSTNVMDWFNYMVKDKLLKNPAMYYVISSSTTTKTTRKPTNFIDLT